MSYSFNIKEGSKGSAVLAVRAELAKVVEGQPIHAKDSEQAAAAAESMIAVLADDESQDVAVSVNGYLSWRENDGVQTIQTASVGVTASLSTREA